MSSWSPNVHQQHHLALALGATVILPDFLTKDFPSEHFPSLFPLCFCYSAVSTILSYLRIKGFDVKALRAFRVLRPLRLVSGVPSKLKRLSSFPLLSALRPNGPESNTNLGPKNVTLSPLTIVF